MDAAFKWGEPCPWWCIPVGTPFYFFGCTFADRKASAKTFWNAQGALERFMLKQSSRVTPVHESDARWTIKEEK